MRGCARPSAANGAGVAEVAWAIELLRADHDRDDFESGEPALDAYLRRHARQNDAKDIGRTYVATRPVSRVVRGYYTLRTGQVAAELLPAGDRRRLPRYPVPVVHLARLAVDRRERGLRLGETLLLHALERAASVSSAIGVHAVEVNAKTDGARGFYARYGFGSLVDDARHMYLSMKAIRAAFGLGTGK